MPDIANLIQSGIVNPWVYLPLAVLLGALHALEPGHSKSIMAAFIIAIRGTAGQAVLLGVAAATGHTIVVWALALLGLWLGDALILDKAQPWLVMITGALIIMLALRLLRLTWTTSGSPALQGNSGSHDHGHAHDHKHDHVDDHSHDHAGHNHMSEAEIQQTYGGKRVGTLDILWFGFTGGLLPCPAAIAVLLVSLQLKKIGLGIAMVAAFSLGLAATLVAVGLFAAWGAHTATKRWPQFERYMQHAPRMSGMIVLALGIAMTVHGYMMLPAR